MRHRTPVHALVLSTLEQLRARDVQRVREAQAEASNKALERGSQPPGNVDTEFPDEFRRNLCNVRKVIRGVGETLEESFQIRRPGRSCPGLHFQQTIAPR